MLFEYVLQQGKDRVLTSLSSMRMLNFLVLLISFLICVLVEVETWNFGPSTLKSFIIFLGFNGGHRYNIEPFLTIVCI